MFCCFFDKSRRRATEKFPISTENERTLVIIRGDAIARGIVGEIIHALEAAELKIVAMKTLQFDKQGVEAFYPEHKTDLFFPTLEAYLTEGYHLALVFQGFNAVAKTISIKGNDPRHDPNNTLRKKFALNRTLSTVHSSDSVASAEREIALCFKAEEIFSKAPDLNAYHKIAKKQSNQNLTVMSRELTEGKIEERIESPLKAFT